MSRTVSRPSPKAVIGTTEEYVKAIRRADRLREIEMYGKVISTRPPTYSPSRKAYSRKRDRKIFEL